MAAGDAGSRQAREGDAGDGDLTRTGAQQGQPAAPGCALSAPRDGNSEALEQPGATAAEQEPLAEKEGMVEEPAGAIAAPAGGSQSAAPKDGSELSAPAAQDEAAAEEDAEENFEPPAVAA